MKITLSIPDEVLESVEHYVNSKHVTLSALFTDAVREYLLRHRRDGESEKLSEVCSEQPSSRGIECMERQRLSLLKEEWHICG
jgi:metal-responsive CopG/Arc/MetJ family transcriptional regulator